MGYHGLEQFTIHPSRYTADEVIGYLESSDNPLYYAIAAKWRADRDEADAAIRDYGMEAENYKEEVDNLQIQLSDLEREFRELEDSRDYWQDKAEENEEYKAMYEGLSK